MLSEYKKVIKITEVSTITGVLKYEYIYDTQLDSISDEVTRIENAIKVIDRVPTKGDKMYFLNGVTVPRFKIKKFCKDKGPVVVKYIESCNLAIIGKNTIKEHFDWDYYYRLDKDEIKTYLNNWIMNNEIIVDNVWAEELLSIIDNVDDLYYDHGGNYNQRNYIEKASITLDDRPTVTSLSVNLYDRLQKILNLTCDIIDESTILKQLNSTVIMDKEIYESIQRLMDSSDNENMKLAMELMSNCDYDNSAMYLLLLLKKYSTKIYNMSNKNHVNFKAMLNYFGFTSNSNFNIDVDDIIEKLKKRKLLVPSQLNILVPLILEDYNPESEHYRAASVTFIDEDGNDIIIQSECTLSVEREVLIDNPRAEEILEELQEMMELDPIIYDELTEVIKYCHDKGMLDYRDELIEIRGLSTPPNALLKIIEYLDETGAYEQSTLLIQCYLSMP